MPIFKYVFYINQYFNLNLAPRPENLRRLGSGETFFKGGENL